MAARRSKRAALPTAMEAHAAEEPADQVPRQGDSDDDNDAPEEVTLGRGKEDAAQRRRTERAARQHAAEASKERRKRQRPAASAAAGGASPAAAAAGEGDDEEEGLDLLPESVIEAMAEAEANDRRLLERRLVTEELRTARARPVGRQQRREFDERQAGPVTVRVLGTVGDRRASDAAKAFLAERLHAGVKRSSEMLQPTKVGGMFIHAPKMAHNVTGR